MLMIILLLFLSLVVFNLDHTIFRNKGFVLYSSHLFHLDVLNQKRLFEDGYNEYYSYDDCILNRVAKSYQYYDIKDILKSTENKAITKGIDESLFKDLSIQLEHVKKDSDCNDPNLNLQTTFTLTGLDYMKFSSVFEVGYTEPLQFGLEFPSSALVKEVCRLKLHY